MMPGDRHVAGSTSTCSAPRSLCASTSSSGAASGGGGRGDEPLDGRTLGRRSRSRSRPAPAGSSASHASGPASSTGIGSLAAAGSIAAIVADQRADLAGQPAARRRGTDRAGATRSCSGTPGTRRWAMQPVDSSSTTASATRSPSVAAHQLHDGDLPPRRRRRRCRRARRGWRPARSTARRRRSSTAPRDVVPAGALEASRRRPSPTSGAAAARPSAAPNMARNVPPCQDGRAMADQELKAGSRWQSVVDDTQVIVVKAPNAAVELQCGGHPMVPVGSEVPGGLTTDPAFAEPTAIGKRFADEATGTELLATKGGAGHARPQRHGDPAQGRQAAAGVGLRSRRRPPGRSGVGGLHHRAVVAHVDAAAGRAEHLAHGRLEVLQRQRVVRRGRTPAGRTRGRTSPCGRRTRGRRTRRAGCGRGRGGGRSSSPGRRRASRPSSGSRRTRTA